MSDREIIKSLEEIGFREVHIVDFPKPNQVIEQHTHDSLTIHVMLEGEISLIDNKGTVLLKKGDRYEIPAGTTHTAICGPNGCKFIVGFK
jgi:quercetin dioxygenase-like cupin family protein